MTGYVVEMPGGAAESLRLHRHSTLTIRCLGADVNVAALIYALDDPTERLNLPDTLKAQMSACIRPPMTLISDMGRAMLSVTGSSLEWHDAITGHGPARQGFLDELWKHDLGERDLHGNVNFFTKIAAAGDERGTLTYVPGHAAEGDWLTLRAEIDVLLVLSTAPHPMAPPTSAPPTSVDTRAVVRLELSDGPVPEAADPVRLWRAETGRALELAERSHA